MLASNTLAPINRVAPYMRAMERNNEPRPRVYWVPVVKTSVRLLIIGPIVVLSIQQFISFRRVIHLNARA